MKFITAWLLILPLYVSSQNNSWRSGYDLKDSCGNYFIVINKDKKICLLDSSGKPIISPGTYDKIEIINYRALNWNTGKSISHKSCLFTVEHEKNSGIVNEKGEKVVPIDHYDELNVDFGMNGTYPIFYASKNDKYGFFDPNGKQITGYKYKSVDTGDFGEFDLKDGKFMIIAYVSYDGENYLLLDKEGKEHKNPN